MLKLTEKRTKKLCLGSTFLATGGGFPFEEKFKNLKKLLSNQELFLVDADELDDTDFVCAVSGIGSAGDTKDLDLSKALEIGIKKLEEILNPENKLGTSKKIKAVVPGEVEIENIIFEIASKINKPVLDADTAGRRAVPEMTHDTFFIAGESILPVVLVSLDGNVKIINTIGDDLLVESIARQMAIESKSKTVILFSHAREVGVLKNIIALKSLSLSIEVGSILANKNFDIIEKKLKKLLKAKLITKGRVFGVGKKRGEGFLFNTVKIVDKNNNLFVIHIKNEALVVYKDEKIISVIPDSICFLDLNTMLPLHSTELILSKNIAVFEIPAIDQWKTERGENLFGEKYLRL